MTSSPTTGSPANPTRRRLLVLLPLAAFVALAALFYVRLGAGDSSRLPSPLIGKAVPRVDTRSKVDGSAGFGMDVRLPGMVYAVVARPSTFGATPARYDAKAARAVRGVLEVRSHETPFLLEDGQAVARLVYEPLSAKPSRFYGAGGSHYQRQGLKLSKHFRAWP